MLPVREEVTITNDNSIRTQYDFLTRLFGDATRIAATFDGGIDGPRHTRVIGHLGKLVRQSVTAAKAGASLVTATAIEAIT